QRSQVTGSAGSSRRKGKPSRVSISSVNHPSGGTSTRSPDARMSASEATRLSWRGATWLITCEYRSTVSPSVLATDSVTDGPHPPMWYAPGAGGSVPRRTWTPVISPPAMTSRGSSRPGSTKPICCASPVSGPTIRDSSRRVEGVSTPAPVTWTSSAGPAAPSSTSATVRVSVLIAARLLSRAVADRADVEEQRLVARVGLRPARWAPGQPQHLVVGELHRRQVDAQRPADGEGRAGEEHVEGLRGGVGGEHRAEHRLHL